MPVLRTLARAAIIACVSGVIGPWTIATGAAGSHSAFALGKPAAVNLIGSGRRAHAAVLARDGARFSARAGSSSAGSVLPSSTSTAAAPRLISVAVLQERGEALSAARSTSRLRGPPFSI